MENNRHKREEIVQMLRQVEVLVGQGTQRVDAIREVRIPRWTAEPRALLLAEGGPDHHRRLAETLKH